MTNKERRDYIVEIERTMIPEGQSSYEEQLAFEVVESLSDSELVAFAKGNQKEAEAKKGINEYWNALEAKAEEIVLELIEKDIKAGKRKRGR